MGALILAPLGEGSQIGVTPRVQVVDGQQRLTTFQLFLAALREVARMHEFTGIIDQANGYLFNQPRSKDTDPLVRFKLTPTPSDREIFHDIIDIEYSQVRAKYQRFYWGSGVPKNTPFRALRAYDLFRKWISEFALNGPSDAEPDTEDEEVEAADEGATPEVIEQRLDALLSAVLAQMKLVVITLGEGDDAQVIFETLNSKGQPLLAMDLIAAARLPEDEQDRIARLVYSYIVRRAVCDLTNKNLNKLFQAVSQKFFEDGPSYDNLREFFVTRSGESSRFPGDEEFRRGILQNPVYQLAPGDRNKDILWELELASRSKFAEKVARPGGLWTEHVLPVSWTEDWPFAEGEFTPRGQGHPKAEDRDRLLHTLGNLTLITGALNISSGNKGFAQKREKFDEHTSLFLNKWFAKRETWTEADIRDRGQHLAEKALVIWPGLGV
eukprot:jgi/Tetstr1/444706/TSEL_032554.t1